MVEAVSGGYLGCAADRVGFRRPGLYWEGGVLRVAIDWHAAVGEHGALAADAALDFASLVVHFLPADFVFESLQEIVKVAGGRRSY